MNSTFVIKFKTDIKFTYAMDSLASAIRSGIHKQNRSQIWFIDGTKLEFCSDDDDLSGIDPSAIVLAEVRR